LQCGVGAGLTQCFAFGRAAFAGETDAFSTAGTGDARGFEAGHLFRAEGDADPLRGEKFLVGELAVGAHLGGVFFHLRIKFVGAGFGAFESGDADGAGSGKIRLRRFGGGAGAEVDEGGGHLAPVAKFEGALAEAAGGDDGDGVGGAAIDFDDGDEALAVGVEGAVGEMAGARVVNVEPVKGEHGHADAEDLAGAEMAVSGFGFVEEGVE